MKESLESLETFRERLVLARSRLLRHEPFLGFMTLELPTHILDDDHALIPTAATDGRNYYYNYRWCRQLADAELVFVIAHEVAHVLFLHLLRRNGRDAELWNAACDFAINGSLVHIHATVIRPKALRERIRKIGEVLCRRYAAVSGA